VGNYIELQQQKENVEELTEEVPFFNPNPERTQSAVCLKNTWQRDPKLVRVVPNSLSKKHSYGQHLDVLLRVFEPEAPGLKKVNLLYVQITVFWHWRKSIVISPKTLCLGLL